MPAPKVERDRALSDDEIRLFWRARERIGWPYGPLFKLLLLTAQRRNEVAEAKWIEFDLDRGLWELPRERSKNDKAHLVHLAPQAIEILEALPRIGSAGFVFTRTGGRAVTGFGHGGERLLEAMAELNGGEVEHFTLTICGGSRHRHGRARHRAPRRRPRLEPDDWEDQRGRGGLQPI